MKNQVKKFTKSGLININKRDMNKTVYLESTLNILAQKDLETTQKLVASGIIKEVRSTSTEDNVKYLVVEE